MLIYPAIDLFQGKAVRLFKGDYAQMTVYSEQPASVAQDFLQKGAQRVHLVDLEGARSGETPNLSSVVEIKRQTGLFCEVGGGVRSLPVIERYLSAGVDRVILGTAAVTQPGFVEEAVRLYGEQIAVGIDIRDGFVAIKGWQESSDREAMAFAAKMRDAGVRTLICTDISRDGAMQGSNHALYRELSQALALEIIASGGVSSLEDIKALRAMDLHGAIIGKAYYTGAVDLAEAIEVAK
ncbi:MAG: 1-(5-phosphoribosyl)-5-[(5-phosphoribosylamino)methylideneamino]imidazole-4-carboxamide isomerase [Eubacteriales bacterium]|nr:1-(5-phosphoribosyl)-5-[(5-phosphoribosylamino)methylideneamino]imidazole-4-carboxamide isomerase [Eubacteriales bacterium]